MSSGISSPPVSLRILSRVVTLIRRTIAQSKLAVICLAVLFIIGSIVVMNAAEKTIIVVDLEHRSIGQPSGKVGAIYQISATSEITLDARKFDFTQSLFPTVHPDAVQFLIGKDRQYSAKWSESALVDLTPSSLTPINDSPPFSGLKSGDSAIIAIGAQRLDPAKNEIVLKALWVGEVDVR